MPSDKLLLAFDTSAAHCAAALLLNDKILSHVQIDMTKGQAESLFPMLGALLKEQAVEWRDLNAIGVGIGPGNFTGIRISVAAARGLALSLKRPAIGVSSLKAQSYGHSGTVISTLDARRDNVYFQTFDATTASEPSLCHIDQLADLSVATHTQNPPICVGFRGEEIAAHFGGKYQETKAPIAVAIAHIAAKSQNSDQPRPAPLYIRNADAAPSKDPAPVILPPSFDPATTT